MKLKKGILLTALTFVAFVVIGLFTSAKATTITVPTPKQLMLDEYRTSSDGTKYGYRNTSGIRNYVQIWKIYDNKDTKETYYCIKGGPGFGSTEMKPTITPTEYSIAIDMKDEENIKSGILSNYINTLRGDTRADKEKTYERLMWVLDQCYVAPETEEEKAAAQNKKEQLLNRADKYADEVNQYEDRELNTLTDNEIEAIQQLAIWYYTNNDGAYNVESINVMIKEVSKSGVEGSYQNLDIHDSRIHSFDALFNYLIRTPQNANFSYDYKNDQSSSKVVKIADTNITTTTSNGKTIVGPYRIECQKNSTCKVTGTFKDANGQKIENYTLLDEKQAQVKQGTTLTDLVGSNFYISVPSTTNTSNVSFEISGEYSMTKTTYWSVVDAKFEIDQPIVQLERIIKPFEDTKTYGTSEFDLALRKFITAINGKELTGKDSRIPQISDKTLEDLTNGSTLTVEKAHTKDPREVNTGYKVIYTIRIYNEGEIDGYATEITDYLPEGLAFIPAVDSETNKKYGWTSQDGKTIKTDYAKDKLLKAFAKGGETNLENEVKVDRGLSYIDLQIECEVIAKISRNDKSLTNIAEITGNKDIKGNTNVDIDRDSEVKNVNSNPEEYNPQKPTKGIGEQDDDDFEELLLPGKYFDLALRKFITSINGNVLKGTDSRVPQISDKTLKELADGDIRTAEKAHTKDPREVKKGDKVIYTIRIYNEGEIDGYATEIADYLPTGLKFVPATESEINQKYGWTSQDGKTIKTDYTKNKLLKAYVPNGATNLEGEVKVDRGLSYIDLQIECEVIAKVQETDNILKNIAEITGNKDINGNKNVDLDRDSQVSNVNQNPNKYNPKDPTKGMGEQDDDDYEDLIIVGKYFDLSLRKFIISVVDSKGKARNLTSREPQVDTTPLVNKSSTTANYNHIKEPVGVSNGDIVTYTIRVYNEGQIDGYIDEITDHLPKQLEYILDDETNAKYGWTVSEDGRTVTTDITSPKTKHSANRDILYATRSENKDKVLLKAFEGKQEAKLDYIDVQIRCRVKENINLFEKITNIAEITEFTDNEGDKIVDRDSQSEGDGLVDLPDDKDLPEYKGNKKNKSDLSDDKYHYEGQQDDDDFEKLVLQKFDLALRKFITKIVNGEKVTEVTDRVPVFVKENNEYRYEHTKKSLDVANGNTVIYTLRIYNEGNMSGYATKVKDDIPDGLVFLPEDTTNTAFGWKMYKEDGTETKNVSEANYIETDFLSKDNEKQDGEYLIKAFDPDTMKEPDYKELKVAFKVTEPNTSDRIIINQAQISEDSDENGKPVDDIDSIPNEWNDDEDDQDIEKIKVKYFDLSLKKWVTEAIVTINGKTTVTKSGHTGDENPEPPMKVELQTANLNKTIVKFRFNIKVTNEGEIEGYATELIDYIPDGLRFDPKDNPKWTVSEDGRVTTDQLKDKLLKPGESATVDIVLTWINGKNNMGEKVNWAEISKDKNEYDSPDIDSTPDNFVKDEDDIDRAPVLLSPATGKQVTYITLVISCITLLAGGIFLIKKYVI